MWVAGFDHIISLQKTANKPTRVFVWWAGFSRKLLGFLNMLDVDVKQ